MLISSNASNNQITFYDIPNEFGIPTCLKVKKLKWIRK